MSRWRWNLSTNRRDRLAVSSSRVVDFCVLLCLFVVPLWFGGRHDLGRFLYACSVATATVAWAARCWLIGRQETRSSSAHLLMLAAIGLVALQLFPLAPSAIRSLSPALTDLAPAWTPGDESALSLGVWQTLSVTPSATAVGLSVLISHVLLFVVVVERLRSERDVRHLLYAIGAASAAMAAFGIIQWLTSNGKLMWFYSHPQRAIGDSVQGSFANKNHFAHFVVLGLGPALMAWRDGAPRAKKGKQSDEDRRRSVIRLAWSVAIVVGVVGVVLSLSRGGLVALVVALMASGVALLRQGWLRPKHASGLGVVAAAALLVLSFGDTSTMFNRFDDLTEASLNSLDANGGRQAIWAANLSATQSSPWFGYGVGSHADVYPAFISRAITTEFTHAESGYLHTLTETGLLGAALMVALMFAVGRWCLLGLLREADPRRQAAWAAVVAGLAASVVHSLVDFVWYIPSCMAVTVLLAACALRLHQLTPVAANNNRKSRKLGWAPQVAAPLLAVMAVSVLWAPASGSLAWDRYLRASVAERQLLARSLGKSPEESAAMRSRIVFLKQQMIDALEEVVAKDPGNARAHLRLAGRQLQQFELQQFDAPNAIGLTHIRGAALASEFPSRQKTIEWLQAACGENARLLVEAHRHTLAGLKLAPLQGDGYGYLANLSFLSAPGHRDVEALMDQALAIRPRDGGTLYEAGKQALLASQPERAFELWKQAHRIPGTHRTAIIAQLAAQVPAEVYLQDFEPDWRTLSSIYGCYFQKDNPEDLRAVALYAAELGAKPASTRVEELGSQAAWRLASLIMQDLEEFDVAVEYAEQAAAAPRPEYITRRCLAAAYARAGRLEDATPHLRWCLSRQPLDRQVQNWLKEAQKQRLSMATPARSVRNK